MQFTTPEERGCYFESIRDGNAELGSAQEHASTFNLGISGGRFQLMRDCARIFAEELLAWCSATKTTFPLCPVLDVVEALTTVSEFRQLFDLWRREIDHETDTYWASIIESQAAPPPLKELTDEQRDLLDNQHQRMCEVLEIYNGSTALRTHSP